MATTAPLDADRMLAGIRAWVELESPSDRPDLVNRVMDRAAADYAAIGASVERVPGQAGCGDHLIARAPWGSGEPGILVLSHLDTVHPVGTLSSRLPWRVEGDRAYGPGTYDMKGGCYLVLAALDALMSGGARTPLPVTHLIVSDEEIGSPTSRPLIERLGRENRYVLVTEPTRDGGRLVTARKGTGMFTLTITGRPAHAGVRHADGRSAVRELAHQILMLEAMTDYERGITVNVGVVSGGTKSNVIPETATAEIDFRVPTVALGEELIARVQALTPRDPDVTIAYAGGMNRPPFERTPAVVGLYGAAQAVGATLGLELGETYTGGGSDGNFTAPFTPTLDGLGVDGGGAHTLDEHLLVSSLVPRGTLMLRLLEALA